MLRKRLNTSGYKEQKSEAGTRTKNGKQGFSLPSVLCLLLSAVLLLASASCAPRYAEKPAHKGIPLDRVLSEFRSISSIEAVLYVEYEKNDSVMGGDAFLTLSEDKLNLRLYYLGFPAGEVSEDNGVIKSKPKLNRNKSIILVDGLKNSFLWWTIKDYAVQEKDNLYILKNYNRKILISKETLLPVQQTIELDNGDELSINYDSPAKQGAGGTARNGEQEMEKPGSAGNREFAPESPTMWYQSKLSIKFKNHLVRVRVKSYSVFKNKS